MVLVGEGVAVELLVVVDAGIAAGAWPRTRLGAHDRSSSTEFTDIWSASVPGTLREATTSIAMIARIEKEVFIAKVLVVRCRRQLRE